MKIRIVILSLFILLTSVFCACSGSNSSDDDKTTTTQRPTTVIGQAVKTTKVTQSSKENIAYLTDDNITVKMEYFDDNGSLKFTEQYLYNEYGDSIGYSYYDKDGKFVAKYLTQDVEGFYYEDGTEMSESEFSVRMYKIGAMD